MISETPESSHLSQKSHESRLSHKIHDTSSLDRKTMGTANFILIIIIINYFSFYCKDAQGSEDQREEKFTKTTQLQKHI